MSRSLSRRTFIKRTSQGVAAAVATGVLGVTESTKAASLGIPASGANENSSTWIHDALQPGMKVLSQWHVDRISPLYLGAVVVLLENKSTCEIMRVDISRKIGAMTVGVESTPNHELIVMNGGDGKKWTHRRYHLVVRALARMLKGADLRTGDMTPLLTHQGRIAAHGAAAVALNPFDLMDHDNP